MKIKNWLQTLTVLRIGGGTSEIRQTEIYTAEPLVPKQSAFEFEKLKKHNSPGIDQIPAELIKTGG